MGMLDWVKDAPGLAQAFWNGLTRSEEPQRGRPLSEDIPGGDLIQQSPTQKQGVVLLEKFKSELLEIEDRADLSPDEKVRQVTHISCATCAGIAIQPIPLADIFILTPIQIYMGTRIAAIRGVPVSEAEAEDILKEIVGAIGLGLVAQQTAIGIWKFLTGGLGGFATIPIVYGLTFAIMRVMDHYFIAKAENKKLSPEAIKSLWSMARSEGEKRGQQFEQKAQEQASMGDTRRFAGATPLSVERLTKELEKMPATEECKGAVERLLEDKQGELPSHFELWSYAYNTYGNSSSWPQSVSYCYVLLAQRSNTSAR